MVPDRSADTTKRAFVQLAGQEHVVRHVVLAADTKTRRGHEAKAWIVRGVTDDDDCPGARTAASFETGHHEARPDALALPFRCDGHGGQPQNWEMWSTHQRYWREQDVPNDRRAVFGNKGDNRRGLIPQGVNEIGFRAGLKGGQIDSPHALFVPMPLVANHIGVPKLRV